MVQAVTNQMAVFHMQNSHIPAGVRKQIEKMQRDFIWNEEDGKRKLHAIGGDLLCKPKEVGGYGLRDCATMDDALIARIGWNVVAKPESLCSLVLRGKYERKADSMKECIVKKLD